MSAAKMALNLRSTKRPPVCNANRQSAYFPEVGNERSPQNLRIRSVGRTLESFLFGPFEKKKNGRIEHNHSGASGSPRPQRYRSTKLSL